MMSLPTLCLEANLIFKHICWFLYIRASPKIAFLPDSGLSSVLNCSCSPCTFGFDFLHSWGCAGFRAVLICARIKFPIYRDADYS